MHTDLIWDIRDSLFTFKTVRNQNIIKIENDHRPYRSVKIPVNSSVSIYICCIYISGWLVSELAEPLCTALRMNSCASGLPLSSRLPGRPSFSKEGFHSGRSPEGPWLDERAKFKPFFILSISDTDSQSRILTWRRWPWTFWSICSMTRLKQSDWKPLMPLPGLQTTFPFKVLHYLINKNFNSNWQS